MVRCHQLRVSRAQCRRTPMPKKKKPKAVMVDGVPIKPISRKGLVKAFEKWAPRIAGCSRAEMNRVYCQQTGREMSDYILLQRADKAVRYNQLPPEAEVVRRTVLSSDSFRLDDHIQPEQAKDPSV